MKKMLLLSICCIFLLTFCSKEEKICGENALLLGPDFRKCAHPLCGGWWIEIQSDTLRFFDVPFSTNVPFHSQADYPIEVVVEWTPGDPEYPELAELIEVQSIFRAE